VWPSKSIANDGITLKILVINPGVNTQGATLEAIAKWLPTQGVNNALDLDGSGSSQLYFRDTGMASKPSDTRSNPTSRYYRPVPIFIAFQ
jgi:exopolysaccharide biosynthesis protein